jgi:hypothetical protein
MKEGLLMGKARKTRRGWRALNSKRGRKKSGKQLPEWGREIANDDESAETEEIDRLLLSSLKFWETERDLIEERLAASRAVRNGALHRSDIAA